MKDVRMWCTLFKQIEDQMLVLRTLILSVDGAFKSNVLVTLQPEPALPQPRN